MDGQDDRLPSVSASRPENYGGLKDSNDHLTFKDLGIDVNPTTRRTIFGKIQTCTSLKDQEKVFLLIAVVSFLASIGLTIERLVTLNMESDDYTFAVLLCVATVFCLFYAVGGIFLERPFELLVCVISTIIVTIYTVLNFAYGYTGITKLIRMVLAVIFGFVLVVTGSKIGYEYYTSRDLIVRTVGANLRLQSACNVLYLTTSLFGFDLQLAVSMLIFVMTHGAKLVLQEQLVLAIGVPFSVIWLLLGYFSLRLESRPMAVIFILLAWIEPAYVIYKFIVLRVEDNALTYSTIACGAAALLVRAALVFMTILANFNFNLGLKEKVYGLRTPRSGSLATE